MELIPGENHWETYGYHVYKDGRRLSDAPIRPGETLALAGAGTYNASAVEWSGLESEQGVPLTMDVSARLSVLLSKPDNFSWTKDRLLVNGREVSAADAKRADESLCETVHLHDGVIHRTLHHRGQIVERRDLNRLGQPTRRLYYEDAKLARREYFNRDGYQVSTELFDAVGRITESIQHGSRPRHWWYDRCVPTKYARGEVSYVPEGQHWVPE